MPEITFARRQGAATFLDRVAFWCDSTEEAALVRRDRSPMDANRGHLDTDHAELVLGAVAAVRAALQPFWAESRDAIEKFSPKTLPRELPPIAARAYAALDAVRVPVDKLKQQTDRLRADARPSPPFQSAGGVRMEIEPGVRQRLVSTYDAMEKHIASDAKRRAIIRERAEAGDFDPLWSYELVGPTFRREEVLDDDLQRRLIDIFIDRAGVRHRIESGETAVSMATILLDHAEQLVAEVAGPRADREPPLETPDGRAVPRRRQAR
jgi:hypothetical protein